MLSSLSICYYNSLPVQDQIVLIFVLFTCSEAFGMALCDLQTLSNRQTFSEVSAILQDDSYVQEGSVKLPSLCTCMQEQQDVLCCFSHNFWILLCCVNECILCRCLHCVQGLIWCGRYECVMVLLTVDVLCGSDSCLLSCRTATIDELPVGYKVYLKSSL